MIKDSTENLPVKGKSDDRFSALSELDDRIVRGSNDYEDDLTPEALARLQAESDLCLGDNEWAFSEENDYSRKTGAAA